MPQLRYIDALRGIAILGVFIVHTCGRYDAETLSIAGSLVRHGARGVQLFFLVSAFTMFLSYQNRAEPDTHLKKHFFIRRFFRIAPLYYIAIVYYLIQDGFGPRYWLGDAQEISTLNVLSNISFLHWVNPYWMTSLVPGGWSISIEVTFYLLVPYLIRTIKNLNQAVLFFLFSIGALFLITLVLKKHILISDPRLWSEYLFFYFPNQLPIFSLGIIAYFIIIKKDFHISPSTHLLVWLLSIGQAIWGLFIPVHVFFGLSFLALIWVLSRKEFSIIVNGFTCFIGKVSYSMYFSHFAVIHWLDEYGVLQETDYATIAQRVMLTFSLSLFSAWVLYNLIEKPFQTLGKKVMVKLA